MRCIGIRGLDQRTDRCWCGIKRRDFVVLDHFPETTCIGIRRYTFEHDLRQAGSQRTISNISVARYPAHVSCTPKYVARLGVKHPLHGELGPQQITR